MKMYKGKGVYGAVAVGKVFLYRREAAGVKRESITDAETEICRLDKAKDEAIEQLRAIYKKALTEVGKTNAEIFEIHMMMIEDEDYSNAITEMIKGQMVNAEYAVARVGDNFAEIFSAMNDSYMQARASDVKDISNRIIACLTRRTGEQASFFDDMIVCADDLTPSETVSLDKKRVIAFATANGSSNSHTAILARSMGIPAIIGLGEEFLGVIKNGDEAVADGFTGEFILAPDKEVKRKAEEKCADELEKRVLLEKLRGKENITLDGTRIEICANIGSTDSIGEALLSDGDGIGLFRSEFLYLERDSFPTEEEQFRIYKRVLESMAGKRVIIRTLDIGADKQCNYFHMKKEDNPAMGLRGIRLCLSRPEIFEVQLRALYRASVFGRLGIMFPMIASEWEFSEVVAHCEKVKRELREIGIPYSEDIELGIMIETPAAALISDRLAPMADFFSIGTNDLTQYALACDRQNPDIERFCEPRHEAILRLIEMTAKNAHEHGTWVGICGELGTDTTLTERFLRMGIDELSVPPSFVLRVREAVRGIDLSGATT